MPELLGHALLLGGLGEWLANIGGVAKVIIGFSIIIFVHELGHFLAAKWVGARVDRFAVGFGYRLCGWRRGEGFTFGDRPEYTREELHRKHYGETDYCLKALPIGGYVRLLADEDIIVDEGTGEMRITNDPRAFPNRPAGARALIISAGVIFNLLFGVMFLASSYLVGRDVVPPTIGMVEPGGPAARGGLQPGDHLIQIDGKELHSFQDAFFAVALSEGDVSIVAERNGERVGPVRITPEITGLTPVPIRWIGISAPADLKVGQVDFKNLQDIKTGDRLVSINGKPATVLSLGQVGWKTLPDSIELTLSRTGDDKQPEQYTAAVPTTLAVRAKPGKGNPLDRRHLLGLLPRLAVDQVLPDTPAAEAGVRRGDIIYAWGELANPRYEALVASIQANAGRPVKARLLRDGELIELEVTPAAEFSLTGSSKARIGVAFDQYLGPPVVADTAPDTPAAALNLPRGALLVEVAGEPVKDWIGVARALRRNVGKTVTVKARAGENLQSGEIDVPKSYISQLGLSPLDVIVSIGGEKSVQVDGKTARLPDDAAIAGLLKKHVGEQVEIAYIRTEPPSETVSTGTLSVTNQTPNAWEARVYTQPQLLLDRTPREVRVDAGGNLLTAAAMGLRDTRNTMYRVYLFLRGLLVSRNIGVQHVSGPVGIVSATVERAKAGWGELLFQLGFISVQLAILNFLPIPLLDGGQMLFLIIEKVKGSALSLKTQMISTLVGLALILLLVVVVTVQDVGRLLFG